MTLVTAKCLRCGRPQHDMDSDRLHEYACDNYDMKAGQACGGGYIVKGPKPKTCVDSSSDLFDRCVALCEIVDGIYSPNEPWRSKSKAGQRLKDTPEWCAFYVTLNRVKVEKANDGTE